MGNTYSRNPDDYNYSGNVRQTRKQRKLERQERHKNDQTLDANLEVEDDHGKHTDNFKPRNGW